MIKSFNKRRLFCEKTPQHSRTSGFSIAELLIVLTIISILSAISLPYIFNYRKLYKSEEQALKVLDLLRETNQSALTRRRTFRFEIDLNTNEALIIDENGAGASDDSVIKAIPLEAVGEIRMDKKPLGVSKLNLPNYADASFAKDTIGHQRNGTTVIGNSVWAARFKSDGSVVDKSDNFISATLYSWAPLTPGDNNPRNKGEVRAITIFGGSGAVRYWKFDGSGFLPY